MISLADISTACGVAAKKLKFFNNKRGVYWWSEEVALVRKRCVAVRRLLTRRGKRGGECDNLLELYRKAKLVLCRGIKKAKMEAWGNLIKTLDDDPGVSPIGLLWTD